MKPAIDMDEAHLYTVDGTTYPSVTTILDKTVATPFTVPAQWGQRTACEGIAALLRTGYVGKGMTGQDLIDALVTHRLSVNDKRDKAADIGTLIHKGLEDYCADGKVPQLADYPKEAHPRVRGLVRWLIENQPVAEAQEVRTVSTVHGYAGTFDLRCIFAAGDHYGARALVDLKNTKRVYDKHYIQLEAYEEAEREWGVKPTDFRAVLHLSPTGRATLKKSNFEFEDFRVLLDVFKRAEARKVAA